MSPSTAAFLARSLMRARGLAREDVLAFQARRLRQLVDHAYRNVPHYRELFDRHGLRPGDVRTLADLGTVPLTHRRDLQGRPAEEVVARGADPARLIHRWTSGSSGEPLVIRRSWREERMLNLFQRRAIVVFGWRPSDRCARVVAIRQPDPRDQIPGLGLLARLANGPTRRFDCMQPPARIAAELLDWQPDIIVGFPTVLTRVAQAALADPAGVRIRPRFVAIGGEVVTEAMRREIEAAFAAPVRDFYAAHEFNLVAWQCPATGAYHTCDDGVLVEVLRDGRPAAPGERGIVVATGLHSFAMPFVRYVLGDIVTRGPERCTCGHPFSTIGAIQGRMVDYFALPDGGSLHTFEIVGALRQQAASWIRQYRVVQQRRDLITLAIVPFGELPDGLIGRIRAAVVSILGRGVELQISVVPELPLEPSGKFRPSRSLVHSGYDGLAWETLQAGPP